ncbi:MAG: hypothetical protein WAK94_09955 [Steroidobacteraceae bacterium]
MRNLTALAVLSAALTVGGSAFARGIATVTVIDRDSGTVLNTYYHQGEYWVAGRPGDRYAIEVRNCTGQRLLAVTSVDGVNVLSGATAAWDQAGYVFDPGEEYEITGWRKSNEEVAAFTFTAAADSYAERTGRPTNIGVIGVALFRERGRPAVYSPPWAPQQPYAGAAAPLVQGGLSVNSPAPSPPLAAREYMVPAPETKLGTGHGEREHSYVSDTEFQRMQSEPNDIIRIRYDSFENLVAMGVIRRSQPTLPAPDPFPDSRRREFVPDPPG